MSKRAAETSGEDLERNARATLDETGAIPADVFDTLPREIRALILAELGNDPVVYRARIVSRDWHALIEEAYVAPVTRLRAHLVALVGQLDFQAPAPAIRQQLSKGAQELKALLCEDSMAGRLRRVSSRTGMCFFTRDMVDACLRDYPIGLANARAPLTRKRAILFAHGAIVDDTDGGTAANYAAWNVMSALALCTYHRVRLDMGSIENDHRQFEDTDFIDYSCAPLYAALVRAATLWANMPGGLEEMLFARVIPPRHMDTGDDDDYTSFGVSALLEMMATTCIRKRLAHNNGIELLDREEDIDVVALNRVALTLLAQFWIGRDAPAAATLASLRAPFVEANTDEYDPQASSLIQFWDENSGLAQLAKLVVPGGLHL